MNGEEGPRRDAVTHALPAATARDLELFRATVREPFESELRGSSMGSTIPGGSRIRISPAKGGQWQTGQVVAFLAGSRVMVHRVIYVGNRASARGFVITHGDGNWMCDPPVTVDSIAGSVEQYLAGEAWQAVGPAPRSAARCMISFPTFTLLRLALEWHPPAAMRLARLMSYTRMMVRWPWTKLTQSGSEHVRN